MHKMNPHLPSTDYLLIKERTTFRTRKSDNQLGNYNQYISTEGPTHYLVCGQWRIPITKNPTEVPAISKKNRT